LVLIQAPSSVENTGSNSGKYTQMSKSHDYQVVHIIFFPELLFPVAYSGAPPPLAVEYTDLFIERDGTVSKTGV